MSEKPFTDAEMARCFTCGHRGVEHAHGTGACFSVKKWAANCACPVFVAVDPQHDPVQRVLAKIDQGAPISRDEMHHAVHEAAHRRTPIAHRSTEGVTPAEMMEWPEMQALSGQVADPLFDREPRPAPTREEIAAMAVHDALDLLSRLGREPNVYAQVALQGRLGAHLRVAANNLPSVTERIAP